MAFSILPQDWATVEDAVAKAFILLGVLIMGPWVALIVYDLALYGVRMILHVQPDRNDQHDEAGGTAEAERSSASGEETDEDSSPHRSGSDDDESAWGRGRARIRGEDGLSEYDPQSETSARARRNNVNGIHVHHEEDEEHSESDASHTLRRRTDAGGKAGQSG